MWPARLPQGVSTLFGITWIAPGHSLPAHREGCTASLLRTGALVLLECFLG
jgi:hypothetical protein